MAKTVTPAIEAEVTLLSTEAGGRSALLRLELTDEHYRPHVVVGNQQQRQVILKDGVIAEEYLGVQFRAGPNLAPGQSAKVKMDLMYFPNLQYENLIPGATFTLREGGHIVGYGKVLRREENGAI